MGRPRQFRCLIKIKMTIKSYFLKQIQLIASWLLVKSQLAFDNDNIRQLNYKNPSRVVNELALKKDQ